MQTKMSVSIRTLTSKKKKVTFTVLALSKESILDILDDFAVFLVVVSTLTLDFRNTNF